MNPQVVSELKGLYTDQLGFPHSRVAGLTNTDVDRWSDFIAGSRSQLYDQIALFLARGFQASELSFAFCDAVINDLHGIITSADEHRPEFFWSVYLAFDEGEYYHGNNREEDPVEVYTRPMISRVLDGPLPDGVLSG
jgi:hypothetical protein